MRTSTYAQRGHAIPHTKVIRTADVHVGDKVTEIDTPEGPFYVVTRETAKSFWVDASWPDDGTAGHSEVRFGKSLRAGVRVVVGSQ